MTTQPARTPLLHLCEAEFGMGCAHTAEGHALHPMRRRLAAATPSKWSDAIVTALGTDGWVEVSSIDGGAVIRLWHHENLATRLQLGDPVALHATYQVLAIGTDWRSVTL